MDIIYPARKDIVIYNKDYQTEETIYVRYNNSRQKNFFYALQLFRINEYRRLNGIEQQLDQMFYVTDSESDSVIICPTRERDQVRKTFQKVSKQRKEEDVRNRYERHEKRENAKKKPTKEPPKKRGRPRKQETFANPKSKKAKRLSPSPSPSPNPTYQTDYGYTPTSPEKNVDFPEIDSENNSENLQGSFYIPTPSESLQIDPDDEFPKALETFKKILEKKINAEKIANEEVKTKKAKVSSLTNQLKKLMEELELAENISKNVEIKKQTLTEEILKIQKELEDKDLDLSDLNKKEEVFKMLTNLFDMSTKISNLK